MRTLGAQPSSSNDAAPQLHQRDDKNRLWDPTVTIYNYWRRGALWLRRVSEGWYHMVRRSFRRSRHLRLVHGVSSHTPAQADKLAFPSMVCDSRRGELICALESFRMLGGVSMQPEPFRDRAFQVAIFRQRGSIRVLNLSDSFPVGPFQGRSIPLYASPFQHLRHRTPTTQAQSLGDLHLYTAVLISL